MEGVREVGDYQSRSKLKLIKRIKTRTQFCSPAHGISPERRQYLKSLDLHSMMQPVQMWASSLGKVNHARKGYDIVVFDDPEHPGGHWLMGYAEGRGHVVCSLDDVEALPAFLAECVSRNLLCSLA